MDIDTTVTTQHQGSPTRNFVRHYVEMVVAMLLGMAVLYAPLQALLGVAGVQTGHNDAPALMLLLMAFTMTVPMVAWMFHRGHGPRAAWEMTGAMFVPTFAAIGLMAAGILAVGGAMVLEHTAMFSAMLAVMLARRDEYTRHV
jgi:hypothetical protein